MSMLPICPRCDAPVHEGRPCVMPNPSKVTLDDDRLDALREVAKLRSALLMLVGAVALSPASIDFRDELNAARAALGLG